MGEALSKAWTREAEKYYRRLLAVHSTFAERHLIMCICDSLKYDGRSEAAKRAAVQSELRLAAATDMDIEELADLLGRDSSVAELKKRRAAIRERGIKKEDLGKEGQKEMLCPIVVMMQSLGLRSNRKETEVLLGRVLQAKTAGV